MARAKRPRGSSFAGLLNQPIDAGDGPWTVLPSDLLYPEGTKRRLSSHTQKLWAARIEKLPLLAKHYSIDEGPARFFLLALRLATDFVPGFWDASSPHTPRGPGRKKGLGGQPLVDLVKMLKNIKADAGRTDAEIREINAALGGDEHVLKVFNVIGDATTDAEACEIIVALLDRNLVRSSEKLIRKRQARTLANRLSAAKKLHEK
jgi:hypothetical protein